MRNKINHLAGPHDVLLVGPLEGTVVDSHHLPRPIRHCRSLLDAITLSEQHRFDAIFVALSGIDGHLDSALGALRRMCHGSRIVLLVEMHQEILARQVVGSAGAPHRLADEYLICPVQAHAILECGLAHAAPDGRDATVAALTRRVQELEQLATLDDLTGLKNRRYMREFLSQILSRAGRQEWHATLLMFDIDDFKKYNDLYGHAVGDAVLRQVAVLMQRCCRRHDVVGRIGGDEFAVIFWDLPSERDRKAAEARAANATARPPVERRHHPSHHPREAYFMAERFRRQISAADLTCLGAEGKGTLTISGGLATFPEDAKTPEDLFAKADQAMLEAKRSGKNRVYLVGKGNNQ
jgi:diguanylate cyclase (GGDEF)-like protein